MLSGEGNFPANLQTMNGAPLSPCRAAAQFNYRPGVNAGTALRSEIGRYWPGTTQAGVLKGITRAMKTHSSILVAVSCVIFMFGRCASFAGEEQERGTPEAPPNAKAVAGSYYRGDGTGYNIYLTLKTDGKYTAEWHGCLGKYGEASGQWTLKDKQITFKPSKEKDMMKGHLKALDILKFKGKWIFVPTDDRDFYDKWGVSRCSCFQKHDKK
jgi:hypothetical protein